MSSSMTGCRWAIYNVAFLQDAGQILTVEYGSPDYIVQRWRTRDGHRIGVEMKPGGAICSMVVSNDGEWIVTCTDRGLVTVWDAETHAKVTEMTHGSKSIVVADVSPDSTTILTRNDDKTAILWDIKTGRQLLVMEHPRAGGLWPLNVKFSPDGTRITTSCEGVIRVFDSVDGTLLRKIEDKIDPMRYYRVTGIAWSRDGQKLFTETGGKITCFDADTGSVLARAQWQHWQAYDGFDYTEIAVARQGFLVAMSKRSMVFWDTSTFTQIGPVLELQWQHFLPFKFSLSPDGLSLAVLFSYHEQSKIVICNLEEIIPLPYFVETSTSRENSRQNSTDIQSLGENSHQQEKRGPTLSPGVPTHGPQLPLLHISHTSFTPWIQDDLTRTEAVLTEELTTISSSTHIVFANRALVRTRMQQWHAAQEDVKRSLDIQLSVVGVIAKSVIFIGLEKYKEAFRTIDLALAEAQCDVNERKLLLLIKSIMSCMAGDCDDATARITDLINLAKDASVYLLVQAQVYLSFGDQYKEQGDFGRAIQLFELARVPAVFRITPELQVISLIFGWQFKNLGITVQQRLREALIAIRGKHDVLLSLLPADTSFTEEQERWTDTVQWINEFIKCRVVVLERIGDEAVESNKREEALSQYMAALSLSPSFNDNLLMKWAEVKLAKSSWESALSTATEFKVPTFWTYHGLYTALDKAGRWIEASECLCAVDSKLGRSRLWQIGPKWQLGQKLRSQLDSTTPAQSPHEVIRLCSAALSLDLSDPKYNLVKRSKALALVGKWEDALRDANEVIALDPSFNLGYERRHAALLGAKHYDDAFEAYKVMVSKLSTSPDWRFDQLRGQYIDPSNIEATIREVIERATRDLPRVLINTTTGRTRNRSEQISAFTATPTYKELCASMTTQIDHARIEDAVKKFYQYAMFSHTWEGEEPAFQLVERIPVYDLQHTLTNDKLRQFCMIVSAAGILWAWSDTCCIDQKDQVVLQESLVSMFRWYHGSEWTVVFLRGDGPLEASRWISRVWTNQEYVAAKRIWFYTGNWTPYLGLPATVNHNHKDDPRVREAMVSSVKDTAARRPFADGLQPGLDHIREKLCVASTRNTTLPEDFAYSLFGIFSVSIPVIYGEGENAALGRLLGHLLTASGDASILAWTGESGSFNSCFPAHITVFQTLATAHLPAPFGDAEISSTVHSLRSSVNPALAATLYDRLNELPVPSFSANRMKLPCILFQLGPLAVFRRKTGHLYRARTAALGEVDIQTNAKLHQLGTLYLIHPWLNSLFPDREFSDQSAAIQHFLEPPARRKGEVLVTDPEKLSSDDEPDWDNVSDSSNGESNSDYYDTRSICDPDSDDQLTTARIPSSAHTPTPRAPPALDAHTRALRLLARLKQPFGALLLSLTDRGFQRVAADAFVKVQLKEDIDLSNLIENVRTVDVL